VFGRRARKSFDAQPTAPCEVLLASDGRRDFTRGAVAEAAALAVSGPVAVLTIAKIYGTAYGIPNPGLLPSKEEVKERQDWLEKAVVALRKRGVSSDAQLAATRKPVGQIIRVARARSVRYVVIDASPGTGLRGFIEGDVGKSVARKLRSSGIEVRVIPAPPR
jgi:hypothetical protein